MKTRLRIGVGQNVKEVWNRIYDALTQDTAASVVDMVLVAVILYALFAFLKKNNAQRLVKYVVGFAAVGFILSSELVGLTLTGKLLAYTIVVITLGVATMFPQELRRSLWRLSSPKDKAEIYSTQYDCSDDDLRKGINDIVRAVQNMAKNGL